MKNDYKEIFELTSPPDNNSMFMERLQKKAQRAEGRKAHNHIYRLSAGLATFAVLAGAGAIWLNSESNLNQSSLIEVPPFAASAETTQATEIVTESEATAEPERPTITLTLDEYTQIAVSAGSFVFGFEDSPYFHVNKSRSGSIDADGNTESQYNHSVLNSAIFYGNSITLFFEGIGYEASSEDVIPVLCDEFYLKLKDGSKINWNGLDSPTSTDDVIVVRNAERAKANSKSFITLDIHKRDLDDEMDMTEIESIIIGEHEFKLDWH
jgi:hypothetical protein